MGGKTNHYYDVFLHGINSGMFLKEKNGERNVKFGQNKSDRVKNAGIGL
jgi:hypothetical protein